MSSAAALPAPVETAAPASPSEPRAKDAFLVFACCFATAQVVGVFAGLATIASWVVADFQPRDLLSGIAAYFSSPWLYLGAAFDGLLSVVIVWYFGCRRFGRTLAEGVDLRATAIGWMVSAPLLGIALALASTLVVGEESSAPIQQTLERPGGMLLVCSVALLAPFYEEIYYRGFMQRSFVVDWGASRPWH